MPAVCARSKAVRASSWRPQSESSEASANRRSTSSGVFSSPSAISFRASPKRQAAINASLDLLRSRKRSKAVAIDDVENSASVAAFVSKHDPAKHQEDRELRALLSEALSRLGPTAAQMFALRYFEGFGNGEIANIMNTSALVVGVTLHRARARLRKEIGTYLQGHS